MLQHRLIGEHALPLLVHRRSERHWQTATCSERCYTNCHWHQEVWSRTVTSTAYWAALAGRPGAGLISLLWWYTDVSRTRRRSICRTTVCQSLKLPVVNNCDLPLVVRFYWFHDIVSEHSAVGLLLWLARRSGTHWQMNCELKSSDRFKLALKTFLFATY